MCPRVDSRCAAWRALLLTRRIVRTPMRHRARQAHRALCTCAPHRQRTCGKCLADPYRCVSHSAIVRKRMRHRTGREAALDRASRFPARVNGISRAAMRRRARAMRHRTRRRLLAARGKRHAWTARAVARTPTRPGRTTEGSSVGTKRVARRAKASSRTARRVDVRIARSAAGRRPGPLDKEPAARLITRGTLPVPIV